MTCSCPKKLLKSDGRMARSNSFSVAVNRSCEGSKLLFMLLQRELTCKVNNKNVLLENFFVEDSCQRINLSWLAADDPFQFQLQQYSGRLRDGEVRHLSVDIVNVQFSLLL